MTRIILVVATLCATSSFAADKALCERAINNMYSVMYSGPKDAAKLSNPKVQGKKAKEIDSCATKMSTEKAECFEKMKATSELEACAKMK
jgi:hypothetical protein